MKSQAVKYGSVEPGTLVGKMSSTILGTFTLLALLVLIPSGLFAGVSWVLISLRLYEHPQIRMILLTTCAVLVLLMFIAALLARGRWLRQGGRIMGQESLLKGFTWWTGLAFLSALAVGAATVVGTTNYDKNWLPYYELTTLAIYNNVDPARTQGAQLLDAGAVTFQAGTRLRLNYSYSFENGKRYCIAPIAPPASAPSPAVYDFWAAGVDCCSSQLEGGTFHCGAWDKSTARGGLRLFDDDAEQYFRLALQQAQGTYHIQSAHPVFFKWVDDPIGEINVKKDAGLALYKWSVTLAFAVAGGIVALGYFGFSCCGH